jgi:hypothetical protein
MTHTTGQTVLIANVKLILDGRTIYMINHLNGDTFETTLDTVNEAGELFNELARRLNAK